MVLIVQRWDFTFELSLSHGCIVEFSRGYTHDYHDRWNAEAQTGVQLSSIKPDINKTDKNVKPSTRFTVHLQLFTEITRHKVCQLIFPRALSYVLLISLVKISVLIYFPPCSI